MSAATDIRDQYDGNLRVLRKTIREVNEANGWYEGERTFGEDLALLHSEVSEAFEAYRDHGFADETKRVSAAGALAKPQGVGSELADVLIRLLDTIERNPDAPAPWRDADLADVEPGYLVRGGAFGDQIAHLHLLIAAGDFRRLLPALVSVAALAEVDLLAETHRKIAYNRTRGYRHGGKRI